MKNLVLKDNRLPVLFCLSRVVIVCNCGMDMTQPRIWRHRWSTGRLEVASSWLMINDLYLEGAALWHHMQV